MKLHVYEKIKISSKSIYFYALRKWNLCLPCQGEKIRAFYNVVFIS